MACTPKYFNLKLFQYWFKIDNLKEEVTLSEDTKYETRTKQ